MKKLIFVLSVSLALLVQVEGQAPPPPSPRRGPPAPPPAPLIFSPPAESDLKDFSPESKLFAARFAGLPTEQKRNVSGAVISTYRVYRKGSNSVVAITEMPINIENRSDEGFGLIRDGIRNNAGKLDKEGEITIDRQVGREFSALYDFTYRRFRVFIVANRIFEIQSDVTNWHIINDKTKEEWNRETDRFFSSFKIN